MRVKNSLSGIYQKYIEKHSFQFTRIEDEGDFDLIVVIPAYKESGVIPVIQSLASGNYANQKVLVIIVFNASNSDKPETILINKKAANEAREYIDKISSPRFIILEYNDLPEKHAGVGLARKIGMDYAVQIYSAIEKEGVISCLDADSQVESNYSEEIINAFTKNPHWDAASIYFEHPISGHDYTESVYHAIIQYELHLRYYINIQKWAGLPYAFQTVGSSMAVRSGSYCRYGGMNTKKAGEDFYFLQKIISKGKCGEITGTTVIPSPRISDRVPFGTGKAVGDMLATNEKIFNTYHPEAFAEIKAWINEMPVWYINGWENVSKNLPSNLVNWLNLQNFEDILNECKKHTSGYEKFRKRVFQWFDAFKLMKFLHWYRDKILSNIPVTDASKWLLDNMNIHLKDASSEDYLSLFRKTDKSAGTKKKYLRSDRDKRYLNTIIGNFWNYLFNAIAIERDIELGVSTNLDLRFPYHTWSPKVRNAFSYLRSKLKMPESYPIPPLNPKLMGLNFSL